MFVASVESVASIFVTVAEKKMQYSTAEVKRAEEAYNLLKNAGYPSVAKPRGSAAGTVESTEGT